ncbi:uncharacterized protein [Musca autumnalis]|uniref:uncharacterized protein n=1 Tax=Musca autumnalis TaxID=221902 RepID=UPI003CEA21F4
MEFAGNVLKHTCTVVRGNTTTKQIINKYASTELEAKKRRTDEMEINVNPNNSVEMLGTGVIAKNSPEFPQNVENECQLCHTLSDDYQNLYDNYQEQNAIYDVVEIYFNARLLSIKPGFKNARICNDCWNRIGEFHQYQISILAINKELLECAENIPIKTEPIDAIWYGDNMEKFNDDMEFIHSNIPMNNESDVDDATSDIDTKDFFTEEFRLHENYGGDISMDADSCHTSNSNACQQPATSSLTPVTSLSFDPEQQIKEFDKIITNWRPIQECLLCHSYHESYLDLSRHFEVEHKDTACFIVCCDEKLKNPQLIVDHIEYHKNPNIFQCPHCGDTKSSRQRLHRHITYYHIDFDFRRKITKPKSFEEKIEKWFTITECAICSKNCSSFAQLKHHFQQHHQTEEFYIACCHAKLRNRNEIEEHLAYHKNPDAYLCNLCSERHLSATLLREHMTTTHAVRRKEFIKNIEKVVIYSSESASDEDEGDSSNDTSIKIQIDHEADAFIQYYEHVINCYFCTETFSSCFDLQRHFAIKHPGTKFQLSCCRRRFLNLRNLAEHMALHLNPTLFTCLACGRWQSSKRNLLKHISTRHPEQREELAKKPHQSEVVIRIRYQDIDRFIAQCRPNLQCGLCNDTASTFSDLKEHFNVQHPQEDCHIVCCNRTLKSRHEIEEHLMQHLDPKAFKCLHCQKTCDSRKALYQHNLRNHPVRHRPLALDIIRKRNKFEQQDKSFAKYKSSMQCAICKDSFPSFTILKSHFYHRHPNREAYVSCCNGKYTRTYFYSHLRNQHRKCSAKVPSATIDGIKTPAEIFEIVNEYDYKINCQQCHIICRHYKELSEHFNEQHPDKPFYIYCCKRKIPDRIKIIDHIYYHIEPNAFKCQFCGQKTSNRYSLRQHILTVHEKKPANTKK